MSPGEELAQIMRDLDKTGAAWVASGYGYETPEHEAREDVFRWLRDWNDRHAASRRT